MRFRQINDDFAVCGQIKPADLSEVKRLGFRSVIVNRPDGEGWRQPRFAEMEEAARTEGLSTRYIPIGGGVSDAELKAFAKAYKELPKPVLAYCRSGNRSATLWALANQHGVVS
ncbi:TIGR01244 family sulfur transferase [Amorphus sp. 3PC139-8]|uniref:TIGR01244 family sulfur transferase n=1 Tax=Amorphus sp. 3PC139-8 TaxID=2735676 RepID=UPI00345D4825